MATTTQHAPGTFCWPELASIDQPAAKAFYPKLFGWESADQAIGAGEVYTIFRLQGRDVGALYTMRKEERASGAPPHWNSYVSVESADLSVSGARALGGTVLAEPFDVMDIGRMSILQDPTGAVFCVWEAKKHQGAGVLDETGALAWTELMTIDTGKARAFYTGLFGWTAESKPMGPMTYTIFKRTGGPAGGMMQITKEMGPMPPHWKVYFAVVDCDAMVANSVALGGKVTMPAHDVPGVGRFAILQDPQGASFAVFEMMMTA